jgi:hypothetical protein
MATQYAVIFNNNSTDPGDVVLFQQQPGNVPDLFPLAWFAKYAYPNTSITFDWQIDYSFVWSQTGPVVPGVVFYASGTVAASPNGQNQIPFQYDPTNQAFDFGTPGSGGPSGSLQILEDANIPLNTAAVGIGMSGAGTFVWPAQPNITLTITPTPTYWIGFGTYTQGQVLSVQEMTQIVQIQFPPNVYTMVATLNPDNSWTIQSLSAANASFVTNRRRIWGSSVQVPLRPNGTAPAGRPSTSLSV